MRSLIRRHRCAPRRSLPLMALLGLLVCLAASCGGDEESTTSSLATSTTSATSSSAPSASTSIPLASTTSTTPTGTTADLPGEPFDLGFPKAGDVLSVVGVAHDDHLNVRAAPGTDQPALSVVSPLADNLVATGAARKLPTSIWYEVQVDGTTGWVGSFFVAYAGSVDDVTSQVIARLGGSVPSAETMLDLGLAVAEAMASTEPASRIVVTVPPTVGDLGEVTYDVIGLGDDSIRGYRLHVFGQPIGSSDGFSLKSVEATSLCGRGVDADGL